MCTRFRCIDNVSRNFADKKKNKTFSLQNFSLQISTENLYDLVVLS